MVFGVIIDMGKLQILLDNIIGKRFGKLVVKSSFSETRTVGQKEQRRYYCHCQCDCGKEKTIRLDALQKERTSSCGCIRRGNKIDEFSPFRKRLSYCIRKTKINGNKRLLACNLTLDDLKNQWEKQNGICPYTGIQMTLEESSSLRNRKDMVPTQASLDRIDSDIGYIKGNVEFVCVAINYAKNGFSKIQVMEFIKNIKQSA
jgi:hypothetical protein